ncbi:MAG: DUF882 domain-containing protein [Anaerolineales bacterium]|nr:DUF882 domain-containing protein [Anaerolineales bacterium]
MTWDAVGYQRYEFACKCGCGFDTADYGLVRLLEQVRIHFDRPVTITSGCRCPEYNASPDVGGSERSQHLYGRAADIQVAGIEPKDVADFLETCGAPGLGRYSTFTHVDSRDGHARWGSN